MELVNAFLSTEVGVAVAAPVLILFGAVLRAAAGLAAREFERRLSSYRRWS